MSQPFDFNKALKALQSGQALTDKNGVLTPLINQLTKTACLQNLNPIWLRMWEPQAKRPLKLSPALSNWQLRAIVMELLSHSL